MPAKIDLKGKTFGLLSVMIEAEPLILANGKPRTRWLCKCACGNTTIASTQSLIQGTTVSCGCYGTKARQEGRIKASKQRMIGKKVGRWFVESYAGQRIQPSGQTRSLWNCVCECGTKSVLSTNQLTEGSLSCGCLRKELTSKRNTIDLTGIRFNSLIVIERIGSRRYGKDNLSTPLWKCKCDCGNECIATSVSLMQGKKESCGCKRRLDLTNMQFGLLTAIEYSTANKKWLCKCQCGKTAYRSTGHLMASETVSCGCKAMSKNELIINDYLEQRKINFKPEYSFEELKGPNGGLLRFDFAILDEDDIPIALIEYQGEQHFKEIENFGKDQREITDFIKMLYCSQTHIPLYTIDYDQDIISACDKILFEINSTQANDRAKHIMQ